MSSTTPSSKEGLWLVRSTHPKNGPGGREFELFSERGFRAAWRIAAPSLVRRLAKDAERIEIRAATAVG